MSQSVKNPCISVCQLQGKLCVSCGRSLDEIKQWKKMKHPQKMQAIQNTKQRLKKLNKK